MIWVRLLSKDDNLIKNSDRNSVIKSPRTKKRSLLLSHLFSSLTKAPTAQRTRKMLTAKRSPQTRRSYDTDIRQFIAFILGVSAKKVQLNDLDLRTVTMNDVLAFADYLETKEYETSTRARRIAAVKSLMRFANGVEWTKFNVAAQVPLPEPEDKLAERILSELEVMTMIALTPKGRDRSIIQLLYYTGARVSEIAPLTWRSVQPGREENGL
ncbi:MAG: site-specific integrase [Desmonostoc vinosum HA7617-LM4]|jgi:integrase/recombinase XerD|nr:site-specific integrase [Desmonostoc vinosum HA7617-LM4]